MHKQLNSPNIHHSFEKIISIPVEISILFWQNAAVKNRFAKFLRNIFN